MNDQLTPLELSLGEIRAANEGVGSDAFKLGVITTMTPPGDQMAGVLVTRGARLGAEYLAERGGVAGGRPIALAARNDMVTAEEDGFGPSAAGEAAKLVMFDGVVAALGQWHLRTVPHVAEICERFGVPIFVENGHSTITHRRNVFRTYFSCADRVPVMLDFLASVGGKRLALLSTDTVFGQEIANTLVSYGQQRHGMEFLRLDFAQEGALDWREQLEQIAQWQPDFFINNAVLVAADRQPPGNVYRIIKQAIEVGLLPSVPMMVCFGFPMRSQDYWNLAGEAGNGVLWPASKFRPNWEGLTPIGRWMTERYMQRFDSIPPDTVMSAFTDVTIIGAALDIAHRRGTLGNTLAEQRRALQEVLEVETFETWRGPVKFGRNGQHWHHMPPDIVLMQYQKFGQMFDDAAVVFPETEADASYLPPASR